MLQHTGTYLITLRFCEYNFPFVYELVQSSNELTVQVSPGLIHCVKFFLILITVRHLRVTVGGYDFIRQLIVNNVGPSTFFNDSLGSYLDLLRSNLFCISGFRVRIRKDKNGYWKRIISFKKTKCCFWIYPPENPSWRTKNKSYVRIRIQQKESGLGFIISDRVKRIKRCSIWLI